MSENIQQSYNEKVTTTTTSGVEKNPAVRILGYTTIGYPFGVHWALTLFNNSFLQKTRTITGIPRLFIFCDQDNFTSSSGNQKLINSLTDDPLTHVYILGEYDHFFAHEKKLKKLIDCFEYWLVSMVDSLGSSMTLPYPPTSQKSKEGSIHVTEYKMKKTNHTKMTLLHIH